MTMMKPLPPNLTLVGILPTFVQSEGTGLWLQFHLRTPRSHHLRALHHQAHIDQKEKGKELRVRVEKDRDHSTRRVQPQHGHKQLFNALSVARLAIGPQNAPTTPKVLEDLCHQARESRLPKAM